MTKAYQTPSKGIKLNGGRLQNGQLFPRKENTMKNNPQRPLNSFANPMKSLNVGELPAAPPRPALTEGEGLARTGAPKNIAEPAIGPTMRNRSASGATSPLDGKPDHAGVQPLDDTPLQKNWAGKGNVPTHPGMNTDWKSNLDDRFRGKHDPLEGNRVLAEAARLGRKA